MAPCPASGSKQQSVQLDQRTLPDRLTVQTSDTKDSRDVYKDLFQTVSCGITTVPTATEIMILILIMTSQYLY
jgi:hypothetical protein